MEGRIKSGSEEERIRRKGIREMDMMDGDGEKRTLIWFCAVVVSHGIFAQHISPFFREERDNRLSKPASISLSQPDTPHSTYNLCFRHKRLPP